MMRLSPRLGRTALLVVLMSAAVAAVGSWRVSVLFKATFDMFTPGNLTGAPLAAEVGEFAAELNPGIFKIVTDGESEGALVIFGHDANIDGELVARFEERFVGEELRARFAVTPLQTKANLTVRVEDDDEGVMIDIGWKDGAIIVGEHGDSTGGTPGTGTGTGGSGGGGLGAGGGSGGGSGSGSGSGSGGGGGSGGGASPNGGFLYEAGVEYDVQVTVRRIATNEATYVVTLKWDGGSYTIGGGLVVDGPLRASQLRFVREANGKHGVFLVDDVIVTEIVPVGGS